MKKPPTIPLCAWCSEPLPPGKKTGRPRRYCDEKCRLAAFRHRQLVAIVDGQAVELEPIGDAQGLEDAPRAPADTDEQVARAVLELKSLGGAFLRLGREARPEFAWRCTETGAAVLSTLDEYFGEAVR